MQDYESFFQAYREKNRPGLYLRSLGSEETKKIIDKCRQMSVSVNDAIVCAFAYALKIEHKKNEGGKIEVGIAINIRNEVTPKAIGTMGNFVSGVLATIDYDFGKSFPDNAREIRRDLSSEINDAGKRFRVLSFLTMLDHDLIDSIFFAEYGDYDNPTSKRLAGILGERSKNKVIGFSNLGKFDFDSQNREYYLQDIAFIQPAFPANKLTIGVLTYNGKMNFCIRYLSNEISDEFVNEIFVEAIAKLKER